MASSSTTSVKSVNKHTLVEYAFAFDTSGSAPSTVFQIPPDVDVVSLQVGAQATAQTIAIQGSNDGTNFATIASATKASTSGVTGVAVFARNSGTGMIGKFPYYRLNNDTATATVSASLSFTKA